MPDTGFPLVAGLTDTAVDALPLHERLARCLSARPGGSQTHLTEALASLEQAYEAESDEAIRRRIAAARSMLTGCGDAEEC
jgi:hypothetical protein